MPQYVLDYGDLQNFEDEIKSIKKENNLDTIVDFDTESNVLGELLLSLLPFSHYFHHFLGKGFHPMESFHQVPQRLRLLWLRTCWPLLGP